MCCQKSTLVVLPTLCCALVIQLVNETRVDDLGTILIRYFNEQYCQQQGHGQENGENILLITLARKQYSLEDPIPQR